MKFIFLIAAFNAFFFSVLLAQKKSRVLHDKILILWLVYLGLYLGIYSFYFSNSANIDLDWLRKLVLLFGIIWTTLISITVIHHVFHMFSMVFCTDGLFLSLSVFVILIGYFGLKQKVIFTSDDIIVIDDITIVQTKYSGSRINDSEALRYSEKLKSHMELSRPYLNPDLKLPQLAAEIGIW